MVELKTEHLFDFYMKFEQPILIGDGPEGQPPQIQVGPGVGR